MKSDRSWKNNPIGFEPKKIAASHSWWADPQAQQDRAAFSDTAKAEESRIVGNTRFGSSRRIHDKFPLVQKAKR